MLKKNDYLKESIKFLLFVLTLLLLAGCTPMRDISFDSIYPQGGENGYTKIKLNDFNVEAGGFKFKRDINKLIKKRIEEHLLSKNMYVVETNADFVLSGNMKLYQKIECNYLCLPSLVLIFAIPFPINLGALLIPSSYVDTNTKIQISLKKEGEINVTLEREYSDQSEIPYMGLFSNPRNADSIPGQELSDSIDEVLRAFSKEVSEVIYEHKYKISE